MICPATNGRIAYVWSLLYTYISVPITGNGSRKSVKIVVPATVNDFVPIVVLHETFVVPDMFN